MKSCWSPRTSRRPRGSTGRAPRGLPTWAFDSKGVDTRAIRRDARAQALDDHRIGTIALAGYMRILIAGIHRAMARADRQYPPVAAAQYRGLDTHARALAAGETDERLHRPPRDRGARLRRDPRPGRRCRSSRATRRATLEATRAQRPSMRSIRRRLSEFVAR